MATTTAGVAVKIGADNKQFLAGLEASRRAAKGLKVDLASIKAPPLPDIGKQIGLQKKQKFESPFGKEWELGLKRGTEKLKVELERQATLYQQANRRMLPAMNRTQLSGTRVPSAGGRMGGGRAGGSGAYGGASGYNAYSLGVGYNAVQDLAQGGIMAIANNVPQITSIIAQSPKLQQAAKAGLAAALLYGAKELFDDGYENVFGNDEVVARNQSKARMASFTKRRNAAINRGTEGGEIESAARLNRIASDELNEQAGDRRLAEAREERDIQSQIRLLKINAIEDPAKRARAAADEQKRMMREEMAMLEERAKKAHTNAAIEQKNAEQRLFAIEAELKAFELHAAFSDEDHARKASLQAMLPGAQQELAIARTRGQGAIANLGNVKGRAGQMGSREALIDASLSAEIAQISAANGKRMLDTFFDGANRGLQALGKVAEEDARMKAERTKQDKQQGTMREQLELAELNAGGKSRKARKLERKMNLSSATDKYKAAGFSEAEAAAMAEREVSASEGRGTIKGAGYGDKDDGASGLDYFDGKKMKGANTSALDAYRAVPSLKERQKKKAPDEIPETTSPVSKGDSGVISVLNDIKDLLRNGIFQPSMTPTPEL